MPNYLESYGPDKLNLRPFYHLTFKSDLDFQPTSTNVSNALLLFNCAKLFRNPCVNVQVMTRTNLDGSMQAQHTHTEMKLLTTMSRSQQVACGLDKNDVPYSIKALLWENMKR